MKYEHRLLLFCALLVYWVYGLWLIFKRKKIKVGLTHLAIDALIFNGDEWYYDIRLAHYCHTEAGYKVYEQVSRKEGLVSDFFHPAPAFIEYFGSNQDEQGEWVSGLWRDVKNPDGKPVTACSATGLTNRRACRPRYSKVQAMVDSHWLYAVPLNL